MAMDRDRDALKTGCVGVGVLLRARGALAVSLPLLSCPLATRPRGDSLHAAFVGKMRMKCHRMRHRHRKRPDGDASFLPLITWAGLRLAFAQQTPRAPGQMIGRRAQGVLRSLPRHPACRQHKQPPLSRPRARASPPRRLPPQQRGNPAQRRSEASSPRPARRCSHPRHQQPRGQRSRGRTR